jgi:hypothetical protein
VSIGGRQLSKVAADGPDSKKKLRCLIKFLYEEFFLLFKFKQNTSILIQL